MRHAGTTVGNRICEELTARSAWLEKHIIPHEPAIRRKLARMGVASDLVEDVVQDAYPRLLNAESVEQIRDSKSYFSRAAASVVLTQVRRGRIVKEESIDPDQFASLQSPEPGPEVQLDGKRQLNRTHQALEALGDRAREVVILRRLEQLTGRQTAQRLSISESAVDKHLRAAMRRLRQAAYSPAIAANDDPGL